MCIAASATTVLSVIGATIGAGATIVENNIQRKTNEYKTQIALNQIKSAQNEAQRQRQLGIEEAREERIEGLKAVSKMQAQNASNGFDAYSTTNLYNYEDTNKEYQTSANNILETYYARAQNYDDRAQDYADNMNLTNMNNDLNSANGFFNSLGKTTKVAQKWYDNGYKTGGLNGNF